MHLLESLSDTLPSWLTDNDQPAFRAAQIRHWLFQSRTARFDQMSDLPATLRRRLADDFLIWTSVIAAHTAADDGTEKLLLQWPDQQQIECVLLRDDGRRTICVSSQVGCAMGCVFCASGIGGVVRNLTSGEILEQMLRLQRLLPADDRLSHIVVMGMGEPLANLDRLLPALELARQADGLAISPRRITISTVGLPPAIHRMSDMKCQYNLAVSLHAANDQLRRQLVPVSKTIPLAAILGAADRYFDVSGRRLTFEYVLLRGINDRPQDADELAELLRGRPALLNIIPYNPVSGLPYRTPKPSVRDTFVRRLRDGGLNVQIRQRKGSKIDAACGQLRRLQPPAAAEPVRLS